MWHIIKNWVPTFRIRYVFNNKLMSSNFFCFQNPNSRLYPEKQQKKKLGKMNFGKINFLNKIERSFPHFLCSQKLKSVRRHSTANQACQANFNHCAKGKGISTSCCCCTCFLAAIQPAHFSFLLFVFFCSLAAFFCVLAFGMPSSSSFFSALIGSLQKFCVCFFSNVSPIMRLWNLKVMRCDGCTLNT